MNRDKTVKELCKVAVTAAPKSKVRQIIKEHDEKLLKALLEEVEGMSKAPSTDLKQGEKDFAYNQALTEVASLIKEQLADN